jgi:hypothetical protein
LSEQRNLNPFDAALLVFMMRHPRAIEIGELAVAMVGNANPSTARRVRRAVERLTRAGHRVVRGGRLGRGLYRLEAS